MKILVLSLILLIPLGFFGKPQLKEIIDESQGLNKPFGVSFDNQGNTYIAEYEGGRIFKLGKSGKLVQFSGDGNKGFAGDGKQVSHGVYNGMHNLAWSSDDVLYVSDTHNHLVRKIDLKTNLISTFAGIPNNKGFSGDGGTATKAKLNTPISISLTPDEKTMLISDISNLRIRAVDLESESFAQSRETEKEENPQTTCLPLCNHLLARGLQLWIAPVIYSFSNAMAMHLELFVQMVKFTPWQGLEKGAIRTALL